MSKIKNKQTGFTLIEIAMVIFIAALALGGFMAYLNSAIANQRINATKIKQESIKSALVIFVAKNNRLPCPAVATIASGQVGDGVESATPGTCTGTITSGAVKIGTIPWVSLGLSSESALDAYANRFTYIVATSATNLTSTLVAGMKGAITIHNAGLGTAANQTNDCSGGGTYNPCSAVVAIISHGSDAMGAYTSSGAKIPFDGSITGFDALENANDDEKIVVKDYSGVSANPYDDSVLALTSAELLSPLVTGGSLKDYRGILNETFDVIKGALIADAIRNSSGATRSRMFPLPAALPALPATNTLDPWGNAIVYTRVTASILASSASNSTAFTLTSYGPDGVVGGTDNISITVTAAELQGIFAKSGF